MHALGEKNRSSLPSRIIPLIARTNEELISQLGELEEYNENAGSSVFDAIEWRADAFNSSDLVEISHAVTLLQSRSHFPLLVTYRSSEEGGEGTLGDDDYEKLVRAISTSGSAAAVDIEFERARRLPKLVKAVNSSGTRALVSKHYPDRTPDRQEIVSTLVEMEKCGADIVKIAVMAHSYEDCLDLLHASAGAYRKLTVPHIAISMGKYGTLSRALGHMFGSSATFVSMGGKVSAPGQIDAHTLDDLWKITSRIEGLSS